MTLQCQQEKDTLLRFLRRTISVKRGMGSYPILVTFGFPLLSIPSDVPSPCSCFNDAVNGINNDGDTFEVVSCIKFNGEAAETVNCGGL